MDFLQKNRCLPERPDARRLVQISRPAAADEPTVPKKKKMVVVNYLGCEVKRKFPGYGKVKWEGTVIERQVAKAGVK